MRRLLGVLFLSAVAMVQVANALCGDTVISVDSLPGYTNSPGTIPDILDPAATNGLNSIIGNGGCVANTMNLELTHTSDTLRLSNPINGSRVGNPGRTLSLKTTRVGGTPNTYVTLTENSPANTGLFVATTPVTLQYVNFARRFLNNTSPSVTLGGAKSIVRECDFWNADTTGYTAGSAQDTGATLIRVAADSVLIERCLFRAPVVGANLGRGRTLAIFGAATSGKLEVRTNLFVSTGLYLSKETLHLYANTFVGSRNFHSPVEFKSIAPTSSEPKIWNNLFAAKLLNRSPVYFDNTNLTSPINVSVIRNAFGNATNISFLATANLTAPVISSATDSNANVKLPTGFSNYADAATDKDYPVYQLRTDPTLARSGTDFGSIPEIFNNYPPSTPSIASLVTSTPANFFFPQNSTDSIRPLYPLGQSWPSGVKVGCFVTLDTRNLPSPLDTAAGSFSFQRATDSTKIKLSSFRLDSNYYGKRITPHTVFFAFADAPAKLTGEDSASLAATASLVSRTFPFADSTFSVPNSLRTGNPVYVKAVHRNLTGFAHVNSARAVITISNIPKYPVNDLSITHTGNDSDLSAGFVKVRVTLGTEIIDSVRVIAQNFENSTKLDSMEVVANPTNNITLTLSNKGTMGVRISVVPIGVRVGSTRSVGSPIFYSTTLTINQNNSNTQYVKFDAPCGTQKGNESNPWCTLDTAFASLAKLGGQIIVLKSDTPFKNSTIKADTSKATITVTAERALGGGYKEPRPVFRGDSAVPALIVKRKNVVLKGLIFEMPSGSSQPALRLDATADSLRIDGNLFRPGDKSIAKGPALELQQFTGAVDVVNNIVWGFATGLLATNTPANRLRFVNNTLLEDKESFPTGAAMTGFKTTATAFGAIISSNFLNDVTLPYDPSLAGTSAKLSNNVYTVSSPNLQGLIEQGGLLDFVGKVSLIDFSGSNTFNALNNFFRGPLSRLDCSKSQDCNSLLAGSSALSDSVAGQDYLGLNRSGKHEVGAVELDTSASSASYGRGYLKIKALAAGNDPTKVNATLTSRNADPSLADSVLIWYSEKSTTDHASSDAKGQLAIPLDSLFGSGFNRVFSDLDGQKTYTFYAAFFKSSRATSNVGYAYKSSVTTGVRRFFPDTVIDLSKKPGTEFPDVDAVFADSDGTFTGKLTFSESVSAGSVCGPTVTLASTTRLGFDFFQGSPLIKACVDNPNLGVNKSKLSWTLRIVFVNPNLVSKAITGEHLYAFSTEGLPRYVPSWRVETGDSGKVTALVIEGEWSGTYDYQFGHLNLTTKPGVVTAMTKDTLDYRKLTTGSSLPISVQLQGSNFRTRNPLILATPVPAGSKFRAIGSLKSPLSEDYFLNTRALSSGLSVLNDTLALNRFESYYGKSALAESSQTRSDSLVIRPFSLPVGLTGDGLKKGTQIDSANLSIDATGALSTATFVLPINSEALEAEKGGASASRSLEVVFTVFDGGKISTSSAFIRTRFSDANLLNAHKGVPHLDATGTTSDHAAETWHLFSYPWDEDLPDDSLNFLLGKPRAGWNGAEMLVYRYNGKEKESKTAQYDVYKGGSIANWPYDSTRALWTATVNKYTATCRSGLSLDYQPFNLSLPAAAWTEFGLPFNFPMRWRDIAAASNPAPTNVWRYLPDSRKWEVVVDSTVVLPWQGIAIRPVNTTVLVFPVQDTNRSPKALAKAAATVTWSASLTAKNATATMDLRIGQSKRPWIFSEAPNVPGQNFRVDLSHQGAPASEVILPQSESSLRIWPLVISAMGDNAQDLQLVAMHQEGDIPLFLVEVGSQTVTPLLEGQPITISAKTAASKEYRLAAGEDMISTALGQGVSRFFLNLTNSPNPFQGATRIRYDLPYQHQSVSYRIRMVDMLGKTVFTRLISGANRLDFTWDGRSDRQEIVAPGRYHLTVEAKSATGVKFRADRDLIKF